MYLRRKRKLSRNRVLFLISGLLICSVYQIFTGNFQHSTSRRATSGIGSSQESLSIQGRKLLQAERDIRMQTSTPPTGTPPPGTPPTGVPITRTPAVKTHTTWTPTIWSPTTGVPISRTPTIGAPRTPTIGAPRTPTIGTPRTPTARTPTMPPNTISSSNKSSSGAITGTPRLRGCIRVGNEIIPAPTTVPPVLGGSSTEMEALEPPLGHSKGEYPVDLFSVEERRQGWVVLHAMGMIYMFIALALVCDEFFVPSLGEIIETFDISDDVAGATFMAAGGSAPELFTSLIGVFISHSNVGIGTIVGSAVFNILFVIGMCAVFSREMLHLTWWPLFRDVSFYILDLIMLIIFFLDNMIEWWESVLLLSGYITYVCFMKFNRQIERWFKGNIIANNNVVKVMSMINPVKNIDSESEEKEDNTRMKSKVTLTRGTSTPSLHNSMLRNTIFQLMINTLDPLTEVKFKLKAEIMNNVAKGKRCSKPQQGNNVKDGDTEQKKTEEKATEEKATEEKATEEKSTEEEATEEKATEEKGTEEVATEEKATEEKGTEEVATEEKATEEVATEEKATEEKATEEVVTEEEATEEKGTEEETDLPNSVNIDVTPPTDPPTPSSPREGAEDEDNSANDKKADDEKDEGDGKGNANDDDGDGDSDGSDDDDSDDDSDEDSDDDEDNKEEDDKESKDEEPLSLEWPDTRRKQITYLCLLPIVFPLWLTVPDVRNRASKKYFIGTFLGSILWIGAFSYLMVWWAHQVGETIGISEEIMGLTILAAGTSIPDLITSVIVARKGLGDMAVSSSVGSNIFDITVGLPVPWLLYAASNKFHPVPVSSNGLFCAIVLLFLMLLFVIISIGFSKWKMNKLLGFTMFGLYFAFLIISVLLEDRIIVCPVSI
ncbi:sodium/potassium/calcium exchanger 2 isoform X2 [Scyliorhinus canicula]|uniref:sodium/potassium/calcium exchanger 2 isoform X2 n=1 Tax=Scyliorhinus canicula TaxID=7830 RepID=UPI0018F64960|nr:sodium/potassium/calcium exchanger 2 isoform X2 [Scyliorhinus canicula]